MQRVADESPDMKERARKASRRWFQNQPTEKQDEIIRRAFESEVPQKEWKNWVEGNPKVDTPAR